jgi:predicted Rossmann fold nucleotide-binding protein DprA/Smf involved in DNA uptake
MNLGIIGSRLFSNYEFIKSKVLENFDVKNIDTIVSGGARGVDTLGEQFADEFDIQKDIAKPDWDKYGKGAAFIRNQEIVDLSDVLIAFPIKSSGGTWDSVRKAQKAGKRVLVFEVTPTEKKLDK